ncbi:calcium-translocating P-type ATPase, PMCA-type [uncultured Tyzzerella sp.]|uniref:calcium-translocating P-type ATPase, PMCA-type n=1 Tax=uncultured Tyzzerella sp. TaxID=2321398 RepID=UPI002942723C|nr:calcium-translocating P-type ATPase, PMCA-type [uncultured Tyzzerella sp.]
MNFYNKSVEESFLELNSKKEGLKNDELPKRYEKYGYNVLQEEKKKSPLQVFLSQFEDLLIIILIVAGIISIITGNIESSIVIFCVIILNAIIGTVQYFKAEQSLKSLKNMYAPVAKVIRNGRREEILAKDLVIGDLIVVEAGDVVPADARVVESFSLQVNESALTGESEAVNKFIEKIEEENISLGDRKNMIFSSSLVTYGRCVALVTSTGMQTEIGKIATLMNLTKNKKTPLQVSLDNFSKKLSIIIIAICLVVFALSLYRHMPILDSLMFAVSLAVAAIPEALSSIVTIALAIGTTKMAKQNAIIKNLSAVEGLGCVSVICSDKTGTLTQNKMTVQEEYFIGESSREHLLQISVLCNDSYISNGKATGDPTETSLVESYIKNGFDYNKIMEENKRLSEIPFDSDRKLMSTVYKLNNEYVMLTKGAIDVILNRVDNILKDGKVYPITNEDIENIKNINQKMSENGLRVLAFAKKQIDNIEINFENEHNLTFVGLISMIDPPREESMQAVQDCHMAGILPIMITGDHKVTATAIAKKIGIFKDGDMSLTGTDLDSMSNEELSKILYKVSVYARVSPEHKIRIVNLWQEKGNIVAMTGDGVNDAPALKSANIGIAMGITGTDVSKDAASVILTDDNFATIIKAVANGRNIYANIKNSIKFLLSGNTSGILSVLYTSIMALPMPFSAVHLLFINLLTDSLPAIAISMDNPTKDIIKEKPRKSDENILTKEFFREIILHGLNIGIFTIIAFYIGLKTNNETASTMAFSTLCLARLWHSFNSRSRKSILKQGIFSNKYIIYAIIIGFVLLLSVLLIPALQGLFDVEPLSINNLLYVLWLSLIPTIIIQVTRIIKEIINKDK